MEDCHENKEAGLLFADIIDCSCWMFSSNKAKYANP
jgi:hypothetical protein